MSLAAIEQAKRDQVRARARLDSTLASLNVRLKPGSLAEEAWDGVKDKSADFADGALQAVKKRPGTVSLALGAFALFLARGPLTRAAGRYLSNDEADEGNDRDDAELSVTEGVS